MSQFFFRDPNLRSRVRYVGNTPQGEPWCVVEAKPNNDSSQWMPFMFGTADWLQLSVQERSWAGCP